MEYDKIMTKMGGNMWDILVEDDMLTFPIGDNKNVSFYIAIENFSLDSIRFNDNVWSIIY